MTDKIHFKMIICDVEKKFANKISQFFSPQEKCITLWMLSGIIVTDMHEGIPRVRVVSPSTPTLLHIFSPNLSFVFVAPIAFSSSYLRIDSHKIWKK